MMRQFKGIRSSKMSNYVAPAGLLEKSIDQTVRTVSDIRSVVSLVNSTYLGNS